MLEMIETQCQIEELFSDRSRKTAEIGKACRDVLTYSYVEKKYLAKLQELHEYGTPNGVPELSRANFLQVLELGVTSWINVAESQSISLCTKFNESKQKNCLNCLSCGIGLGVHHEECKFQWTELVSKGKGSGQYSLACPSPECNKQNKLINLLTTFEVQEVNVCPCCDSENKSREYCGTFNISECNLRIRESNQDRTGYVYCLQCMKSGRMGQMRIVDIAMPDVYISGWNTISPKDHKLVQQFLAGIKFAANIAIQNMSPSSFLNGSVWKECLVMST